MEVKQPAALAKLDKPVEVKKTHQSLSAMGLDLVALEHDAQQQAGNVMANRLAQRAQVLLARSSADEAKAENFDKEVVSLRGNATALAREVNKEVREVSRKSAADVAQKSMAQLKKLQALEHKAEVDAEEHRSEARKALARVRAAQASLHT